SRPWPAIMPRAGGMTEVDWSAPIGSERPASTLDQFLGYGSSTSLPVDWRDSRWRWASAAAASGNVLPMWSLRRASRMRVKQRVALSRVLSGKLRVTVGTMKPLTFCDFADRVATFSGSVGPPA